jgi:hypothetical protein
MSVKRITIEVGDLSVDAELNESETAGKILNLLPLEGRANVWGDEIYFSIPLEMAAAADARADMSVGELGYWPTGTAFCIFYGPTPVSTDSNPRAYSPVNVVGRIVGDATILRGTQSGASVRVEQKRK